jgi:hypothetical protein
VFYKIPNKNTSWKYFQLTTSWKLQNTSTG